ncbi:MAG: sigma 54-interacting transcriptional regulator [Candidatus Cloacimonetes bacterium]|nr:sigma 54-interacting transcriptional regulator [Candidatus Cloacimonadota bacterium]
MLKTKSDQSYYSEYHKAVNAPKQFVDDFTLTPSQLRLHPSYMWKLLYAKAQLVLGETKSALELLLSLKPSIHEAKDAFCMAKYYITLYNAQTSVSVASAKSEEYFRLAEKYVKQSGSRALICELKILQSQKAVTDIGLEQKTDLLKEAMQDAIESNILDLKLEVYLSYIPLYLVNNLPEPANRELTLLYDLVEKDQNPLLYAHIMLYFGIVNLMLRNLPLAFKYLSDGVAWAKEHHFNSLLIPLNINLGIYYTNSGSVEQGIQTYHNCLKLSQEYGLEDSQNAHRIQDNLARALSKMERIQEAVQIIRSSIVTAEASGNELRKYMQYVNLADNIIELKAYDEAEQLINAAITYFTENKEHYYLTFAYRCKARLYEEQRKYKKGFEALEMLDNVSQMHFRENFNKQSAQYQSRIDTLHTEYLRMKNLCITEKDLSRVSTSTDLIGDHPSMKKALKDAFMAARHPYIHVMIHGESGTGKEVIARIIHNESKTGKPLVAINASAISPNLIESELFGHKKGAFTGAMEDRKGKFLMADKGTLLLDEISDMPVEAQVKLLRAIETRSIQPVGSDKEIPVNCRIICTSNKEITKLIHSNQFRLDLYHRLNKVEIILPPLRERLSDLEMITNFFVERIAKEFRVPIPTISDSFFSRLKDYSFPGNVRELANLVERIFILNPNPQWDAGMLDGMLPDVQASVLHSSKTASHHLNDAEAQMIIDAMNKCNWVQKEAAKLLKMSESTLCRHIKKLNISR